MEEENVIKLSIELEDDEEIQDEIHVSYTSKGQTLSAGLVLDMVFVKYRRVTE